MTEYQQGYLQGLRDAVVTVQGQFGVFNLNKLLTDFIARFKK